MVTVRPRAYCNLHVYQLDRADREQLELRGLRWLLENRRPVREAHNLILDSGLNQLRDACTGTAWHLSAIGVGSSGTAVSASQTWGLSPLLCTSPTDSYADGALFRTTLLLSESELNGYTIREIWVSPTTDAPPTGDEAYCRVVIPDLAKTSDFAYLFIVDCTWGGGCCKPAWYMFAALAASGGSYTYKVDKLRCGSGCRVESVSDTGLDEPWTMTDLTASSASPGSKQLEISFSIPPDTYTGETLREVGLYYDVDSGTSPIDVPGLYVRAVDDEDTLMVAGKGALVPVTLQWGST